MLIWASNWTALGGKLNVKLGQIRRQVGRQIGHQIGISDANSLQALSQQNILKIHMATPRGMCLEEIDFPGFSFL